MLWNGKFEQNTFCLRTLSLIRHEKKILAPPHETDPWFRYRPFRALLEHPEEHIENDSCFFHCRCFTLHHVLQRSCRAFPYWPRESQYWNLELIRFVLGKRVFIPLHQSFASSKSTIEAYDSGFAGSWLPEIPKNPEISRIQKKPTSPIWQIHSKIDKRIW